MCLRQTECGYWRYEMLEQGVQEGWLLGVFSVLSSILLKVLSQRSD